MGWRGRRDDDSTNDPDSDVDWEDPEPPDYDDDEEPCIPCPYCHREILEESEQLPLLRALHLERRCSPRP